MSRRQKDFNKLLAYCKKHKIAVVIKKLNGEAGWMDMDNKSITLCPSYTLEKRIYYFLHELGHLLIAKDRRYQREKAYSVLNFSKKSLTSKVGEIEEEFEAWHRGRRLADRLDIRINRRVFEMTKSSALASYFRWATQRKLAIKRTKKESTSSMKTKSAKLKSTTNSIEKSSTNKPASKSKTVLKHNNIDLFKEYDKNKKNVKLRNTIVENNRGLVSYIIKKHYALKFITYDMKEEIMQEGMIALMSAIDRFDYKKGFMFSTYASWWIRQSINNYLLNIDPLIRIPGHIRTAQIKLVHKLKDLGMPVDFNGISPRDFGISEKTLESIKNASNVKKLVYINQTSSNNKDEERGENTYIERTFLKDSSNAQNPENDQTSDNGLFFKSVKETIKNMPHKRRLILLLRYGIIKEEELEDLN